VREATPDYFSTMNIRLLEGRFFTDGETSGTPSIVLVNHAFAKTYFPKDSAIGHRIRMGRVDAPPVTIVGVLADIRNMGLEEAPPPQVYLSFWQGEIWNAYIAVRSTLPPDSVAAAARSTLKTIDPNLALADIHTMGDLVTEATARRRFQTTLLTVFAAVALFLAMVGLYGLMSYAVKQRTSEIGIRMALGANRRHVVNMILANGLQLVAAGLIVGLAGALTLTRILASFLYNVHPADPFTFIAVPALLILVAVAASALPAWRAATTDPTQALRSE
jgi:predicted permease